MIAVVDYGVGNLFSLAASLKHLGMDSIVTGEPAQLQAASHVILPGVGAFGDAMDKLRDAHLADVLRDLAGAGKPLLGICLGMQLLFDRSLEYGDHQGLGLLRGVVSPLRGEVPAGVKVPQIGWNALRIHDAGEPLLRDTAPGTCVYYLHSFYAKGCEGSVKADSEYGGVWVPGLVRRDNVCGTQFHPEKSGDAGLAMLRAFGEMKQ
ncbi:MAG: imidazole glycerol phosphate synthase subunit HisH [Oscillospiraceae bacterium]|jgi:glutamine amidotransferase|nr:imidazole glycerol phosphate synthase subunit HisH [Oscillospiraceae bacterium]